MLVPHSPFSIRILAKAGSIWLAVRVALLLVGVGPSVSVATACGITMLVAGLTMFDVGRRSEHLFLENLGVPRLTVAAMCTMVPAVFEAGCGAVLGA